MYMDIFLTLILCWHISF